MLKRIYTVLFSGALLALQPAFAAPKSVSNVKKIIKKNGKIVVIVRENGVDKEVVISQEVLNKLVNKDKKSEKVSTKVTKEKKKIVKKSTAKKSKVVKKTVNKKVAKKIKKSSVKKVIAKKTSTKKVTKTKKTVIKKPSSYTVKSGDTIFSIARKYKVSISSLVSINSLGINSLIHPGDTLKIPKEGYLEAAKRAVKRNKKTVYTVQRGDTLSTIAKMYGMKTKQLKRLNNFKPHPKLKPGMEINVIGKAKVIKRRKNVTRYAIRAGDTLWSIARKHNLTVAQLRALNPSIRTKGLKRGSILRVSKRDAIRLSKISKKRRRRLDGLLSKYQQRGGSQNVVRYAKRFLGVRYRWGATGRGGFDCSGFTQYVMRHAKGRSIPRVSRRQAYYGRYVSRRNLRAGDLIFFDTSRRRRGYVNHVGIYIGNGMFIHASSGKHRVVITSLNKPFYRSRFMWGRRVN